MPFKKGHKINLGRKRKPFSEKHKRKIGLSIKGEKHYLWGKHHTKKAKKNMSKAGKGKRMNDKNPMWKGDNAGYTAMHIWVARRKGKASNYKCECGKQAEHWSNKKHNYTRNPDDYVARCSKCHIKYDKKRH